MATVKVLVTGGAGFIGSNLVIRLLDEGYAVRVLDDLSTGRRENVDARAELIEGGIDDEALVGEAVRGAQVVFHQAAAGSVARSVAQPLVTDRVNTHGTLTVLKASLDSGVQRVVSASSSSVYGGAGTLPSVETAIPLPRSPYAVSKLAGEHYCRVFTQVYGLPTVALRYFNVYGPRQRPDSAYAAVIPLFIAALSAGQQPIIHGDGQQSRDFTFVDDVLEANLAAARVPAAAAAGRVFNIACGGSHTLLELLDVLGREIGVNVPPVHTEPRPGDIWASQADVSAARQLLGFESTVSFEEGLHRTVAWYRAVSVPPAP
jgi:nucleoside-diphosphate-sugar epimerase